MSPETSKTRVRRLAAITAGHRWDKKLLQLRHRDVLLRMGIVMLTIILLSVFMRAWEPHFPYYVGEMVNRDIVARVPFSTTNEDETRQAREIAMSRVPYIYIRDNDVQTLTDNMNKVARILKEAIKADSFEAMSPELRKNFEPPEGSKSSVENEGLPFHFLRSTTDQSETKAKAAKVPTTTPAEDRAIQHAEAAKAGEDAAKNAVNGSLPLPVAPSSLPSEAEAGAKAAGEDGKAAEETVDGTSKSGAKDKDAEANAETETPAGENAGATSEAETPASEDSGATNEAEKPASEDAGATSEAEKPASENAGAANETAEPAGKDAGATNETTEPVGKDAGAANETAEPAGKDAGAVDETPESAVTAPTVESPEKTDVKTNDGASTVAVPAEEMAAVEMAEVEPAVEPAAESAVESAADVLPSETAESTEETTTPVASQGTTDATESSASEVSTSLEASISAEASASFEVSTSLDSSISASAPNVGDMAQNPATSENSVVAELKEITQLSEANSAIPQSSAKTEEVSEKLPLPLPQNAASTPEVPASGEAPAQEVIPALEDPISKICSDIAKALEPFFNRGILRVSDLTKDPLGRGMQSQIDIIDATPDKKYTLKSPRETVLLADVLLESNPKIREAICNVVGSPQKGLRIFYCICNNWESNLTRDLTLTQEAIKDAEVSVLPIEKKYEISQRIVQANVENDQIVPTLLTPAMISILKLENDQWLKTRTWSQCFVRFLASILFMMILFIPVMRYITATSPRIISELHQMITMLLLVLITQYASFQLFNSNSELDTSGWGLFPLILSSQILAILYRRHVAIALSMVMLLIEAMVFGSNTMALFVGMGVILTLIMPLDRLRGRLQFIQSALWATVVSTLLTFCGDVLSGSPLYVDALLEALYLGIQLVLAGFIMQGFIPVFEHFFGVLSDARLFELCDISHPLLNELVNRASGTYNHSIALGTIAEKAADSINADGLLVRTAAYFHDIGKIYKPEYYAENQTAETGNPHNQLEPTMSALIIIAHVKNGVELARQYKLPEPIIDLIEQHHGSTLVNYFYTQAKNRAVLDPTLPDVEETPFRYPCPKPQTVEAVVLMLADACESASRTLSDPAPARIENLVHKIAQQRLEDNQLDDSGITLQELHIVEESITKALISYHHGRIKYPERIIVKPAKATP